MGNTFKSLVAAAGILAAGDATNAQEGADSTANKTKQALVELLSELPPGFDSARKVIEWDITLAGDGNLSDSDKLAIEGHMWKLATVIPESARKVREAMTGVETIVAADQEVPVGEDATTKRERLKREAEMERLGRLKPDLIREFNERTIDEDSWLVVKDEKNNWEITVRESKKVLSFTLTDWDAGRIDTPEFKVVDGWYEIKIDLAPVSTAKLILWTKNPDWSSNRMELWSGTHKVYLTPTTKAWFPLDKVKKTISLNWLSIVELAVDKIAQQEK